MALDSSGYPKMTFKRFEAFCAFCGQDPQLLRNCQCVFAFFSDPPLPFFSSSLASAFVVKKGGSLSVDLEPIEVIMVCAAALWKYSQSSARHAPLIAYFFQILATSDDGYAEPKASRSYSIELEAERGGMVERFNAPVLKTGDPQGSVGSNPTPSANR
jgi:hypothetical protein